ncbi:MAG: peptide MFS transporter [Deltaproteobacteria bacterium]|nr:peptide MFS transporter [Deltaproteobacteria bacterium]
MLKNHPKGLLVLFFSNMGERFGYYTMMAIFVLYLGAKLGWTKEDLGLIWSAFLGTVYFLPLFGGILADRIGYGRTVTLGIVTMILGYGLMAVPGMPEWFLFGALFVIAAGTGLFKGNLVVILGNLYQKDPYKKFQDAAFNIFYMGINIGAFFAPYAATGIRDFLLGRDGFWYDARLPGMSHEFLNGTLAADKLGEFTQLAQAQLGQGFTDLGTFARGYLDSLAASYNAGFAIAAASIVGSLVIFLAFRKYYREADYLHAKRVKQEGEVELTAKQTRDRIVALVLVFFVVIFFWMAFHQNGLTLTWFAKNYTVGSVGPGTKIFFDLPAFLAVIAAIIGAVFLVLPRFKAAWKGAGAALLLGGVAVAWWRYTTFGADNAISPELFQSFNPIFVVFLTPVVLAFFAWLAARKREPTAPKKIAIGMLITAGAYVVMVVASFGLQSPAELQSAGEVSPELLVPHWLIGTYFSLTIAELFLSPMGLSFVAKVSPPKYRGLMQGGWLAATAIGNILSGFVAIPYAKLELWQTFAILCFLCLLSFGFMIAILKKLEHGAAA